MRKMWMSVLIVCLVSTSMSLTSEHISHASSLGNVIGTSISADQLTLEIDNGTSSADLLEFTILRDNILRVNYRPHGLPSSPSTPMIDPDPSWDPVGATIDDTGDPITLSTSEMQVHISRSPARLTIKKADGTTLLWEPPSGGLFHDGVRFLRNPSDPIYGIRSFSAQEDVGGLLRNHSDHPAHAGQQGDAGGPFIWSTSGYGVLVDSDGGYPFTEQSSGKLEFYYGGTPVEGRRYDKDNVEFYVMLGAPEEIMNGYSKITGTSPMMPKWSLGFMNFEWGINQAEMEEHIDRYRAKNIPLDAYALDYDWLRYGESNYGEFTWNTDNFPDAASTALKNKMDNKGIKLIGIRKPRIVTEDFNQQRTSQYYDAEAGGFWYPGHAEYTDYFIPVKVRSIDHYSQAARDWWWQSSIDAFNRGIVGWWNDETDKVDSWPASYWFGNFETAHNSQAMYEGQRSYTNDVRVWQTARNYYPGTQRFATSLWSGDIGIQFYKGELFPWAPGMQEQPRIMLSSINLGQPKWGMDTGGFNAVGGMHGDNPSPELYARWMQFGAFTPVFRVHGNYNQQRQPWFFGTTAEEVSKAALHIRYSLIPYMYTYERQAYETGVGLVKPLLFDYPQDPNVADYTEAWMFGDWLLVSPVLNKQATSHEIYLPEGTWIDYFRGHEYAGGQTIHYPINAETWTDIPLFIKKGAIIPSQKALDYVHQQQINEIHVDIFPDVVETDFTYYDDDGTTYNYEQGVYFKQDFSVQELDANRVVLHIGAKQGSYMPDVQHYLFKVHGKAGEQVTLQGSTLPFHADLNALKLSNGVGWTVGKDIYGEVTYIKVAAAQTAPQTIEVLGSASVNSTYQQYEAEEASLFGSSLHTRAKVNHNHPGYSGTGFVDGLDMDGAGVTFYVNVSKGGDYPVDIQYANGTGNSQTLSMFVNSVRVGDTTLQSLGNWSSWGTQTELLPLTAGQNIITFKYDSDYGDTGHVNLDYIKVPFEPNQAIYQAESAELSGGASTNQDHWFYSGYSFVDQMNATGAAVTFEVDAATAGSYHLSLRYANGTGSTQTATLLVNDQPVSQLNFPSPAMNWNIWNELSQTVWLHEGKNTIRYEIAPGDSGGLNLDRLLVSSQPIVPAVSERNLLDNGDFERDPALTSNWTEWHPHGQASAYGIDSGSSIHPPESPIRRNQRAYFYSESPYEQSIHQVIDVPENPAHYKLEAMVLLQHHTPHIARVEIAQHGGTPIYYDLTNDGQWHYITIDNIHVTSGQLDVGFYVDSPGHTTLLIDDVRLTKKD